MNIGPSAGRFKNSALKVDHIDKDVGLITDAAFILSSRLPPTPRPDPPAVFGPGVKKR